MTTKELAEQYRIKLGLRTWEEQEQWANEKRESLSGTLSSASYERYKGRQSGRTTRGLLLAIARAVRLETGDLIVEGISDNHEGVLIDLARDLVSKLRLDLRVIGYRRSKTAHYVDHLVP